VGYLDEVMHECFTYHRSKERDELAGDRELWER